MAKSLCYCSKKILISSKRWETSQSMVLAEGQLHSRMKRSTSEVTYSFRVWRVQVLLVTSLRIHSRPVIAHISGKAEAASFWKRAFLVLARAMMKSMASGNLCLI